MRKAEEAEEKRMLIEAEETKRRVQVEEFRAYWAKREEEKEREMRGKKPSKDKGVSKATTATDEAIPGDRDDATPDADETESDDETESEEETVWGETIVLVRILSLLLSTSLLDSLAHLFIYTGLWQYS